MHLKAGKDLVNNNGNYFYNGTWAFTNDKSYPKDLIENKTPTVSPTIIFTFLNYIFLCVMPDTPDARNEMNGIFFGNEKI